MDILSGIHRYQVLRSTSTRAHELAAAGAPPYTSVLARTQTGGRGRLSRSWYSPPGGLYLSVILRPTLPRTQIPLLSLAAGIAALKAVMQISGVQCLLKWPNDIYVENRKLGGILLESSPVGNKDVYVIVGIGINVNNDLHAFKRHNDINPASLLNLTGTNQDIDELAEQCVRNLQKQAEQMEREGPSGIVDLWSRYDALHGREVVWAIINDEKRCVKGTGTGIDPQGRYLVKTPSGSVEKILSGDVTFAGDRQWKSTVRGR